MRFCGDGGRLGGFLVEEVTGEVRVWVAMAAPHRRASGS
jgi:hypothetical protein